MDFRKADPTYVGFKPTTAEEAIDKFVRHRNMGVPVQLWPEIFVDCASSLTGDELDKFESWLVNPTGEPSHNLQPVDNTNESLRKQLLKEALQRDDEKADTIMEDVMIDDYIKPCSEDILCGEFEAVCKINHIS